MSSITQLLCLMCLLACTGKQHDRSKETEDTASLINTDEICDGIDNDGDGEIDNGLSFQDYWHDADGDGYGGPTGFNCSDLRAQGLEDGVYELWPNGREAEHLTVYCDLSTDGGGWARVFYHDVAGGFFDSYEDAYHLNEQDPEAELYSILKHLEQLRRPDGSLELRINWPDTDIPGRNIWRQVSNPTTTRVTGYEPISINYSSQFWGGLELSTSPNTYLDGSVQHEYWFYAIGSYAPFYEGIPAHNLASPRVALWVRTPAIGGVETINACAQPQGYAAQPGDCDDGDPAVSPAAVEVCNGIDDNCDGQIDIGCPYGDVALIESPQDNHFYPRDLSSNTCSVTVQGTGAGAAQQFKLRVLKDGVLHSESTANNTPFNMDANIDAGLHMYEVQILWDSDSGHWTPAHTIRDIVCGDAFLIDGQSNAVACDYHGEQLGDLESNPFVRSYGSSAADASVVDDRSFGVAVADAPYAQAAIGQWGLRMANVLSDAESIPVLVINGAVGGTSVWSHQRNESSPTDVNSIYGRLLWRAQQAGVADSVRAIIWHQGESDSVTPYADYLSAWTAMHNGWLMDYPNLEGAYTFQVRSGCGNPTWNRNVHRDLPLLLESVLGNMSTTGVDGHDECHFYNHTYVEWGERIARLIHRDLYGASYGSNIDAPNPVAASWLSNTELELDFGDSGNGLILQPGAENFFTLSDGVAIASAQVIGSTVVLTIASPSQAQSVSFVDVPGDIPWLINDLGIGSFAWYELEITP